MSAIVLALTLSGAGAAPFIMQSASASVAMDPIEGCDAGQVCDLDPPETDVTVTVTATAGQPPPPESDEEAPETTVTKTVTATPTKATPSKTATPKPTKTKSTPTPQTTPTHAPQPLPTQEDIEVPPVTSTTPTAEASVELPTVAPTDAATTPETPPSQTQAASTEEVPLELRQAAPEYDQRTLTQKLSIPALVLVLLALFAVLIFEGRLRRMAHAAAVRKAGPQLPPDAAAMPPGGYPAGPGYATAGFAAPGYPGGTAYAPIISFVPVQTYPPATPPQYDPHHPYPPQGYVQEPTTPYAEPPQEPVVLHPDEFDSYSEPPASRERDPFEPVIPPEPVAADIPPGGAGPYDPDQDQPLGPASAAESGDSEPWQQHQRGLFEPAKDYEPPPYVPADGEATAIQPLPPQPQPQPDAPAQEQEQEQAAQPQEPTKEMPDSKRRLFGRKKK